LQRAKSVWTDQARFRPARSGTGRSQALANVRTTSRSTRPRNFDLVPRGGAEIDAGAETTASETTSSQAKVLVRLSMRLAVLTEIADRA
jgi:hypothetical protein